MKTYTIFCQEHDGKGTTHVSSHEAETADDAAALGVEETADDWGYDEDEIRVLGIIEGDVNIIKWNDLED